MLKLTIGYGLGLGFFQALYWVGLGVLVGAVVLEVSAPTDPAVKGTPAKLAFSLHHLLPILSLQKSFDDVLLAGKARWYFMFHRLGGWVLGGFLAAGMAGLTQGR
jgi:hypothetical protein